MPYCLRFILVGLLYYVTGKAGLLLVIPEGYATIFWPASGIAMAAVYKYGNRMLGAVFLGSAVLNLFHYLPQTEFDKIPVLCLNAVLIGIGSALQAWVGSVLLKRYTEEDTKLETISAIIRYFIFGGFIAGLVSCSLGCISLLLSGTLHKENFLFSWSTWYIGDVLGIIVFAPLLTILLNENVKKSRKFFLAIPLLILFIICMVLFGVVRDWNDRKQFVEFEHYTKTISIELKEELESYIDNVITLRDFYYSSNYVSREEFHEFSKNIFERDKNIGTLAWSPRVPAKNKLSFESEIKKSTGQEFSIFNYTKQPFTGSDYYPIIYRESTNPTPVPLGLNLASESVRLKSLTLAANHNHPVITDRLQLYRNKGQNPKNSFLVVVPVFKNAEDTKDKSFHSDNLQGFISSTFEYELIIEKLRNLWEIDDTAMSFFVKEQNENTLIYTTLTNHQVKDLFDKKQFYKFKIPYEIKILNKKWTIEFYKLNNYAIANIDWAIWVSLGTSLVFMSLVSMFLFYLTGQTAEIEAVVSQRTKELEKSRQEAQQANKTKSEFLAMMSHEIRTPMTGIIGMVNLLKRSKLPPSERHYVETISYSANSLLQIIEDILDFSKIEAGKLRLENIAFDYHHLCKEVVELFAVRAWEKGIDLRMDYSAECPHYFMGDPIRIRQILFNLCNNAIKFTSKGHVSIKVTAVEKSRTQTAFITTVQDTGIGIPEDKQPHIFEKFNQADNSTTRRFGGSGLGLSISRQLLQMMNSDIHLQSQVGQGSSFSFKLDLLNAVREHVYNTSQSLKTCYYHNKKALLAEDNLVNQEVICTILESFGIHVTVVSNGSEAVNKSEKNKYDIILMDCHMPVMDGFTATQIIRSREDKTPIIAITARAISNDKELCLQAGMDDYLSKPIDEDELIATLSKWLADRAQDDKATSETEEIVEQRTLNLAVLQKLKNSLGEKFAHIINIYIAESETSLSRIKDGINAKDSGLCENAAHSMKTSSGQIGAQNLQHLMHEIELAAKEDQMNAILQIYAQAEMEFIRVKDELKKVV